MGKASSSKKVARAAGTGGGRTTRGKTPVLWYGSLLVVLLAGVGLTAFSRQQRLDDLNSPASKEAPKANSDHWHVALGVRVCDRWLNPVKVDPDPKGIHTHGDGLIHIEPSVASVSGRRATFARFVETVKGDVTASSFSWPEGEARKKEAHKTGDKCGEQVGEVTTFYNGEPQSEDPRNIRLTDGGKLVLAFVPKGTTYKDIGDPPSVSELAKQKPADPTANQSQQVDPTASTLPGTPPVSAGRGEPAQPGSTPPGSTPPGSTPVVSSPPASTPPASTPPASSPPSSVK